MQREDLIRYKNKSIILVLKNTHKYTVKSIIEISDKSITFLDKFSSVYTINLEDIMLVQDRNNGG